MYREVYIHLSQLVFTVQLHHWTDGSVITIDHAWHEKCKNKAIISVT